MEIDGNERECLFEFGKIIEEKNKKKGMPMSLDELQMNDSYQ